MVEIDPLEVLRKAIRLQQSIAEREQKKGDKGNPQRMADAMQIAASLSVQLAGLEHRLGIVSGSVVTKVEVELVSPTTPEYIQCLEDQLAERDKELRQAKRELYEAKGGRISDQPADPMLALPAPGSNDVPLHAAAGGSATQSGAAPKTPVETDAERIARLRWEAGDRPQALRVPFDNGYGRDFGLSGGATRFDNKVPLL